MKNRFGHFALGITFYLLFLAPNLHAQMPMPTANPNASANAAAATTTTQCTPDEKEQNLRSNHPVYVRKIPGFTFAPVVNYMNVDVSYSATETEQQVEDASGNAVDRMNTYKDVVRTNLTYTHDRNIFYGVSIPRVFKDADSFGNAYTYLSFSNPSFYAGRFLDYDAYLIHLKFTFTPNLGDNQRQKDFSVTRTSKKLSDNSKTGNSQMALEGTFYSRTEGYLYGVGGSYTQIGATRENQVDYVQDASNVLTTTTTTTETEARRNIRLFGFIESSKIKNLGAVLTYSMLEQRRITNIATHVDSTFDDALNPYFTLRTYVKTYFSKGLYILPSLSYAYYLSAVNDRRQIQNSETTFEVHVGNYF